MPAIILDRDGVINYESDAYIKSPTEWLAIPGSLEAIARLNDSGFDVFIATNQSGVARGLYNLTILHAIHEKLHMELAKVGGKITDIFYCPHHPDEQCLCRKPKPGMLVSIASKYHLQLDDVYFIGDSHVDIQAALAINCKPVLVLTGKGQLTVEHHPQLVANVPHYTDLANAVADLLMETRP